MDFRSNFVLCTLCLGEECNLQDIFEHNKIGFKPQTVIGDLLDLKLSESEHIPWMICSNCIGKLNDFRNFKRDAVNSVELLRVMMQDHAKEDDSQITAMPEMNDVDKQTMNFFTSNTNDLLNQEVLELNRSDPEIPVIMEEGSLCELDGTYFPANCEDFLDKALEYLENNIGLSDIDELSPLMEGSHVEQEERISLEETDVYNQVKDLLHYEQEPVLLTGGDVPILAVENVSLTECVPRINLVRHSESHSAVFSNNSESEYNVNMFGAQDILSEITDCTTSLFEERGIVVQDMRQQTTPVVGNGNSEGNGVCNGRGGDSMPTRMNGKASGRRKQKLQTMAAEATEVDEKEEERLQKMRAYRRRRYWALSEEERRDVHRKASQKKEMYIHSISEDHRIELKRRRSESCKRYLAKMAAKKKEELNRWKREYNVFYKASKTTNQLKESKRRYRENRMIRLEGMDENERENYLRHNKEYLKGY